MANLVHQIDTKQIRVILTMPRSFGVRMWAVRQLMKIAGAVSPVTIEVSVESD